jgi:sulfatase maturation enzyme AslB (radical SAM superfamily)
MSFDTAKQIIDNLLEDDSCYNTEDKQVVIFDFIGGEPLMEVELIEQIADYFMERAIALNHRFLRFFRMSMASNGLLYFNENV